MVQQTGNKEIGLCWGENLAPQFAHLEDGQGGNGTRIFISRNLEN